MVPGDVSQTAGNGRSKRRGGRQPAITAAQTDRLVELLSEGHTEAVAASGARISNGTYFRWKARGREADDHMAAWLADQPDNWADQHTVDELWQAAGLTANDRPYWEFWERLARARDAATQAALDDIRAAGEPHDELVTVTTTKDVLVRWKDGDGEHVEVQTLVESKTTTRWGVIDWNARAWWLERQRRDEYGRHETVHHDGALPVSFAGSDIDDEIETLLSGGKNRE